MEGTPAISPVIQPSAPRSSSHGDQLLHAEGAGDRRGDEFVGGGDDGTSCSPARLVAAQQVPAPAAADAGRITVSHEARVGSLRLRRPAAARTASVAKRT